MPHSNPIYWTEADYQKAAEEYRDSLPLDAFRAATRQTEQRKITCFTLPLICRDRPEVQLFRSLLVQYPFDGRLRQVVPDNMVVLTTELVRANLSYNLPFEPARPFWVMEYLSPFVIRKDYAEHWRRYEEELRVPYFLSVEVEQKKLFLCRHNGARYEEVLADDRGRRAIPELELEIGLLDGLMRYWFRGTLLLTPIEMMREIQRIKRELADLSCYPRPVAEA